MTRLKRLLLALTPMGAVALHQGGGTFGSFAELCEWDANGRPPRHSPTTPAPRPSGRRRLDSVTSKRALLALMAIGAAAYLGGGGTFASFSAETSNNGSSVASGTLTMSDQVNVASACLSMNSANQNNVNNLCGAALTLTNVAPGVAAGSAKLTIQNTGSVDASKFSVYASYVNAALTAGLTGGVSPGTLTVSPLEGAVATNDNLVVSYGANSQTFVASAPAAAGATSISVNALNANFSYPVGSTVNDTTSDAIGKTTNCYDKQTTTPGSTGATKGTDLNFNPTAGNPLCGKLLFYIQETGTGTNYCWAGQTITAAMCAIPLSTTLSSGLSTGGPITSLPLTAITGNVAAGDSITVTEGSHSQTFVVATGNNYFVTGSQTNITVNSQTPNFNYTTAAVVTDATTLATLNAVTLYSVTNFDTSHGPVSGPITLYPVTSNGVTDTAAPVQLAHYNASGFQRTFQVGVYLPAPNGINQNFLQGLSSTFGLTFHIDQ